MKNLDSVRTCSDYLQFSFTVFFKWENHATFPSLRYHTLQMDKSYNHKMLFCFSFSDAVAEYILTMQIFTPIMVLVVVFGVVGNFFVLMTIYSCKRMQNVTNCFLFSLSLSDLLVLLISVPMSMTGQVLRRWIFGNFCCHISMYLSGK